MAFVLQARTWYAMESVFASAERHHSPVWVRAAEPQKTGAGVIRLDFYHANYAEGVRDKIYDLKVVHRADGYLLALRVSAEGEVQGTVILQSITLDWMTEHFPLLAFRTGIPLASELDRLTARKSELDPPASTFS